MIPLQIGIDMGGSLTKVVIRDSGNLSFVTIEEKKEQDVRGVLDSFPAADIFATGCGGVRIKKLWPCRVILTDEFKSFCAGARYFTDQMGLHGESYILTSFGTGTSIFYVTPSDSNRVSGTAVGGGTLTGLGQLLLGTSQFEEVIRMAEQGDRRRVDLMVSDLYPDAKLSPVLNSLTAANFGSASLDESSPEDIASAIVQMVVETVALLSIQTAKTCGAARIVIAGSPTRNPLIRKRLAQIGDMLGKDFLFLEQGPYCGAMGAMIIGEQT